MQVVYTRCCGLDVQQKTVVACVLLTQTSGQVAREVRVFGTVTVDLLALNEWLNGLGVRQVAREPGHQRACCGGPSLPCWRPTTT